MDKQKIQEAYERGKEYEARATDCCQSAIAAIQDSISCKNDDIVKAGSAFAGGLAFSGQGICGALAGGVMVIGQLYGRSREEFNQDAEKDINEVDFVNVAKGWEPSYELFEWFMASYGSCICSDIKKEVLGQNQDYIRPDSPVRYELVEKGGGHQYEGCPKVVGKAAKWTTKIILREGIPDN